MSEASVQTEIERVIEGAADALSDDIVGRLGTTVGEGLMLLDEVSRSNLDKAIPVINRLVESGDLEKAASLMRVLGAAGDALSDDIVGRLGSAMGEGLMLLDEVSRSNLDKAIPVINRLVESGDLEKAASLMRVLGAAGDALSDDIIGRLGEIVNELLCMADRVARNENLNKLLGLLEQDDMADTLADLCSAVAEVKQASSTTMPSGSLMSLVNTMKDPEVQQALLLMSKFMTAFKKE